MSASGSGSTPDPERRISVGLTRLQIDVICLALHRARAANLLSTPTVDVAVRTEELLIRTLLVNR